jgi:glycosyltransferase involved in cell wall biosynthesis
LETSKIRNKQKIKIALVVSHPIQHFCPQYESFAANIAADFKVFFASKLGYQKYYDSNFKQEVFWSNIRLDKFPHLFVNGDAVLPADASLDAPNLEKELIFFNPDCIIVYGYFQKYQRRAYRWAIKNKKVIAYISDSERRQYRNGIKEWVKYFYLKRFFSKINFFLTVGNSNEEYYQYYSVKEHRFLRMHFPIDIIAYEKAWLQREKIGAELRRKYHIHPSRFVASVVGKLVTWKNQDHIIDAMIQLEDKTVYLDLFIIGSGSMRDQWEEKAKRLKHSKVHFTGFINIEDLPAFYAASNLYIHPASIEPHSIAISEAIFMGCPVIVSNTCGSYGSSDDVQVDKNGWVYRFGNIEELAQRIEMAVSQPALLKNYSIQSHELGVQFQKESHHGMFKKLIERVR